MPPGGAVGRRRRNKRILGGAAAARVPTRRRPDRAVPPPRAGSAAEEVWQYSVGDLRGGRAAPPARRSVCSQARLSLCTAQARLLVAIRRCSGPRGLFAALAAALKAAMTYCLTVRRRVVQMAWGGWGARKIAKATGCLRVSESTVKRIVRQFRQCGDYSTPCAGRRRRPGKIPDDQVQWLLSCLNEQDCTLYLDEMADRLEAKFGTRYRPNLVCATLLRRGVTRKKLTIASTRRNEFERSLFRSNMGGYRPDQLVFIDETRKDPRTLRRRYGRSCKGARALAEYAFTRHASGWSALGVMTIDGMIDCGLSNAKGVGAAQFLEHLYVHVLPHLQPWPHARSVVVLDNAVVHWAPEVRQLVEERGARVLYLPAYSYDLMPIEHAFSKAKAELERLHGAHRAWVEAHPARALEDALMAVTAQDAEGYFRNCGWIP